MTVIAYRNGIMASDSLVTAGTLRVGEVDKLWRAPGGGIVGYAGTLDALGRFTEWVIGGMDGPVPHLGADSCGILVTSTQRVYFLESGAKPIRMRGPFVALGSGEKVAMGAMAAGATAYQAARIACRYDTGCGGKVSVLIL